MFATSLSSFPLTFTYAAQAEAPQGKADVIDVKGPANFTARLFVHADTHLPIMLTWQAPGGAPRPGGSAPPGAAPVSGAPPAPAGPPATAAQPPPAPSTAPPAPAGPGPPPMGGAPKAPVEQRMFFADYREVDGIQLPFRIRRAAGADTTEETTFDRFRINARIDPRRFDTTAK